MHEVEESKARAWVRPELVVLVRTTPEEAVLAGCKWMGGGPVTSVVGCQVTQVSRWECRTDCSAPRES